MNLPERIFLVGLPGAGKSTVGKFLAKELNYTFIDLDQVIEEREGNTISSIFSQQGEPAFRQLERAALRQQTAPKLIVATGGGAPCFHGNMEWMNTNGFTVFLNPPLQEILHRIAHETHRPLMQGDAAKKLQELLAKRKPFYDMNGMESGLLDPCEILTELLQLFKD
jgi:shikimate kinase